MDPERRRTVRSSQHAVLPKPAGMVGGEEAEERDLITDRKHPTEPPWLQHAVTKDWRSKDERRRQSRSEATVRRNSILIVQKAMRKLPSCCATWHRLL